MTVPRIHPCDRAWLLSSPPRQGVPVFQKGKEGTTEHWLSSHFQEVAGKRIRLWRQRALRARGGPSAALESPVPAGNLGTGRGRDGDPPSTWTLSSLPSLSAFNSLKHFYLVKFQAKSTFRAPEAGTSREAVKSPTFAGIAPPRIV